MSKFRYTPEMVDFLQAGYREMRVPELTEAFNRKYGADRSVNAIRNALVRRGFTCGRPPGFRKGERLALFTHEQLDFIREHCPHYSRKQLAEAVNSKFKTNYSAQQMKSCLSNHKIKSGRTGRFTKGHRPWLTGTKGLVKANKGSFAKGNVPPNRKPFGSERTCSKDGYIIVKTEEQNPYTGNMGRHRSKHVVVWEQAHGPVPAGHVVTFKDGDRKNCSLDNLEMITRNELVRRNQMGFHKLPAELKPVGKTLVKLAVKIGERGREL